ncbi:cupin domain-containing protein [uncultured Maritimibacter sp.]|uniref:cupin domain-containing protein n=1 Tax=uncultured Maritimibacter sp. TaxID=991866 RepID=UPI00261D128C|nr:cupin domain-containing protein [uncultured Maritimibacter sp.]
MPTPKDHPNDLQAQRDRFHDDLDRMNIIPLWLNLGAAAQHEPNVSAVPHIWRWSEIKPMMLRGGDLITPQEAERRVLMLINPSYDKKSARTVGMIFGGIQFLMPGEIADSHQHSPNAHRFIIEGEGAYTAVNGERTVMKKGDYVTTPAWTWHDHGNESGQAMAWLDGLDLPFVNLLDANFFEDYEEGNRQTQPIYRNNEDSLHRWGRGMKPAWEEPKEPRQSPILNYRWTDSRANLHALREDAGSPYDGIIMQYVNPHNGGPTLPTISAYLQLLRKGEHTKSHRHTASTIYHVAEGGGGSLIGDREILWQEGDTFVIPSWMEHEHWSIGGEAVLFSYSDRPILQAFGFYREAGGERRG